MPDLDDRLRLAKAFDDAGTELMLRANDIMDAEMAQPGAHLCPDYERVISYSDPEWLLCSCPKHWGHG